MNPNTQRIPHPDLSTSTIFSVDDIVAIVTGGGTGIGLMIAQALEANGATVYIVGRRQAVLEKAAKTAKHGKMYPVPADVTSRADIKSLVAKVEASHDRLDVLVNCAGVMSVVHKDLEVPESGEIDALQKTLWNESDAGWQQQFAVNVTAPYFMTVAFLSLLKKSEGYWSSTAVTGDEQPPLPTRTAQVITVTGIAAYSRTFASCMGYAASKAGAMHLMKTMATVMAPTGIRFNILAPGIFPTEMTAGKGRLDDDNRNYLGPIDKKKVPQGRVGNGQDIAGAILFLCGQGGYYSNGNVVVLDGGRLGILPSTY